MAVELTTNYVKCHKSRPQLHHFSRVKTAAWQRWVSRSPIERVNEYRFVTHGSGLVHWPGSQTHGAMN